MTLERLTKKTARLLEIGDPLVVNSLDDVRDLGYIIRPELLIYELNAQGINEGDTVIIRGMAPQHRPGECSVDGYRIFVEDGPRTGILHEYFLVPEELDLTDRTSKDYLG